MFKKDIIPEIAMVFYLSGKNQVDFDLDEVTKKIGIKPSVARKKHEFPKVSIDNGSAHDYWSFEIREACDVITIPSKRLYDVFFDKKDIIDELCKKYNLEVNFTLVAHLYCGTNPLSNIPKEVLKFISSFDTELGLDLYCYDDNNTLDLKSLD